MEKEFLLIFCSYSKSKTIFQPENFVPGELFTPALRLIHHHITTDLAIRQDRAELRRSCIPCSSSFTTLRLSSLCPILAAVRKRRRQIDHTSEADIRL